MTQSVHRQNVARIVSSLRLVRPHTPFYCLAAHRVPTLWILYRGLLRSSPSPIVRSHIRVLFREHRHLTSPALTRTQLEKGQRWLDIFEKAKQGDEHQRSVLQRFERLICARRNHNKMARIVDDYLSWNHRLLTRSIFTPTIIRPSIDNGPLPRLKPQPDHISGMIHKRRVARRRRVERQRATLSQIQDLRVEAEFEGSLAAKGAHFEDCFDGPHLTEWHAPLKSSLTKIQESFDRDTARAARPTPPDLLAQLKAARREKVTNKTRERERQRRGEVLLATRRQSRLGFPAHLLARWDPEVRKAKLIARRSVGEVGYVGQVKRALGYKIPPEEDEVDELAREKLDRIDEELRRSNRSRRDGEVLIERTAEDSVVRNEG